LYLPVDGTDLSPILKNPVTHAIMSTDDDQMKMI